MGNATYGVYLEQVETKKRLEIENISIEEEKKTLMAQLQAEQGNMGEYTERQAKASAMKAGLEVQLQEAGQALINMEASRQPPETKRLLKQIISSLRRTLKIWRLPFKNLSKKRPTGITQSGPSMMKLPIKMRSSTN